MSQRLDLGGRILWDRGTVITLRQPPPSNTAGERTEPSAALRCLGRNPIGVRRGLCNAGHHVVSGGLHQHLERPSHSPQPASAPTVKLALIAG